MRKLLPLLILLAAVYAKATTTLTINVTSLTGGTSPGNSVRIDLQNCAGARVIGTGQIVAQSQTVYPVGGVVTVTLYDNTQIDCGGGKAVSYYSFNYIYQGVITSIGSYNLPPGTFTLSTLLPCVGNACIGGGSTVVNRIIAGTNITISPTTGLGQVTINSTASGTGNPAAPFFSAQYNNSGVFGGSAATFDAAGNFNSLSLDGLKMAFLNQSAPGANNGIQRSLQTLGNVVIVGQNYPSVEGTYTSTGYRLGIGVPAPFANSTLLLDYRNGQLGTYAYNTNMGLDGGSWRLDRWVSNQQAQATGGGITIQPFARDFEMFGSGKNGFEGGGPDSFEPFQWNFENYRRGIVSVMNIQQQDGSLGDNHIYQFSGNNNRGSSDASGEGFNISRNQIQQNLTPMVATANSTLAAGATLIPGTLISSVPFVHDGTYYIDFTKASALLKITGFTGAAQPTAGTFTVDATLTPDNIGRVATQVNTPKQYYGATTNETVTVTGLAHDICAGNTSWSGSACAAASVPATACYADHLYQESARVISAGAFSAGTQTITVALRYFHLDNAYVAQGPHACNLIEIGANQEAGSFPARQLFRIIGASDSHTYLYSRTVFGNWGSPSGFFSTNIVAAAGATLTRNGSNVVSVPVSDGGLILSSAFIIVSGCTDLTYNGLFIISTDNGSTVTWPNTGAAGTTTCTNAIEIQSRITGKSVRLAQEFPGAEIVNPLDPVTFANNQNITVEPNANFQVTAGDQLENHVYSDVTMGIDHNLIDFHTQTSPSIASVIHSDLITDEIPEGTVWQSAVFQDSPTHYQGLGGTKPIGNTLFNMGNTTAPFLNLWSQLPPPLGSVFSFSGCLFGCTDARSKFTFLTIPTNGGFYSETIHQDSAVMERQVQNVSSILTIDEGPTGLGMVVNGGANGTIFFAHANETKNVINGPSSTSSTIDQTASGWSSSVPITVPSCTGCSPTVTGNVTTTAALTDTITVTGMTSLGHCAAPGPTNAAAGTMIQNATPVFIDTFTTNAITLHHVATAGATFSFVCTSN